LILLAIIILGTALRLVSLRFSLFLDLESFAYYSVIQQTVNNNYIIPAPLHLVGFPTHEFYNEKPGLIYLPIFFYLLFLQKISILSIMRMLPVLFGAIGTIASYLLGKRLTEDILGGYLSAFVFATTMSALYITSGGQYNGQNFTPIFFAVGIIFLIEFYKRKDNTRLIHFFMFLIFSLLIPLIFWNGGLFVFPIILALLLFYLLRTKLAVGIPYITLIGLFLMILFFSVLYIYHDLFYMNKFLGTSYLFSLEIFAFVGIAAISLRKLGNDSEFAYLCVFSIFIVTFSLVVFDSTWLGLDAVPLAVFIGYGFYFPWSYIIATQ